MQSSAYPSRSTATPDPSEVHLNRARSGDAEAIVWLMNRALAQRGIQVWGVLDQGCLMVTARGQFQAPDRVFLVAFVRRGLQGLGAPSVRSAVIEGFGPGEATPAWRDQLELVTPEPPGQVRPGRGPSDLGRLGLGQARSNVRQSGRTPAKRQPQSVQPNPVPGTIIHVSDAAHRIGPVVWGLIWCGLAMVLAGLMRWLLVWLAETEIYELPYAGAFLRTLEAIDLLNSFVFAVLGAGCGLAAALWPRPQGVRLGALAVALALPVLLAIGPIVRDATWVQRISLAQNLSPIAARSVLDRFLIDRVKTGGIWGTYLYSARYAQLPATVAGMQEAPAIERQIEATIATVTRAPSNQIASYFELASWGLRLFYAAVALVAAAAHFDRGWRFARRWGKG